MARSSRYRSRLPALVWDDRGPRGKSLAGGEESYCAPHRSPMKPASPKGFGWPWYLYATTFILLGKRKQIERISILQASRINYIVYTFIVFQDKMSVSNPDLVLWSQPTSFCNDGSWEKSDFCISLWHLCILANKVLLIQITFVNFAVDPLVIWGYHSQPTAHLGSSCCEWATVHALSTMSNADTNMVWHQSRKSPNRRTSWGRRFWGGCYTIYTTPAKKKKGIFLYCHILPHFPKRESCGCIGHQNTIMSMTAINHLKFPAML